MKPWRRSGAPTGDPMMEAVASGIQSGLDRGLTWDRAVEVAVEAWGSTLQASGPIIADSLVRSSPKMLREHRRLQRGFERRLRGRWKRGLDLYYMVYVASEEAGGTFNGKHRPQAVEDNDVLFDVLTRLHARACRTALEVHRLLTGGLAQGALARARTLHEIAVTAMVLNEHGRQPGREDLAERFALHAVVSSYKDACQFQRSAEVLGYEPFSDADMTEMKRDKDELVSRYGGNYQETYGWACGLFTKDRPTFADLEGLAGVAHLRPHYRWASHEVHSDSKGLEANTLRRGDTEWQSTGATNVGLADPGHMALISLHQTTVALLMCRETPDPSDLLALVAIQELIDRAGDALLATHHAIEADESRLFPSGEAPLVASEDEATIRGQ